ncbi:MAG TPA: MFS transporter [Candidatus Limnocylindrales bacterium]|nr:MFS transporter [Candidatus Limnocylindrales bacterium]
MRLAPYLILLRENPAFARLYGAQLITFAGEWFATVALLGLVLELTGSAAAASLVLVLQTGGFAAIAPMAGILADRVDRRLLLIGANCARAPLPLAFLLVGDVATLWLAFTVIAMLAAGAAVFEPTSSASLPNLVDRRRLPEANVLIGSAWGTMLAVGAAVGGLVAATLGREAVFVINALAFVLAAWLIAGIRRPLQQPRELGAAGAHPPIGEAFRVAIAFARSRRLVAAFLLSKTTFGFGTGIVALLAVFGAEVFGAGDAGIGALFAARGLGALAGPFAARAIFGTEDRGLLIGIGASLVLLVACYTVFPLAPAIWVAALLVFAAHCGGGAQWTLSTLGLQRATPDALRGRLFSFDYTLVTLTITVSTLAAGFLADAFDPAVAAWTMVGLVAVAGTAWAAFARPLVRPAA